MKKCNSIILIVVLLSFICCGNKTKQYKITGIAEGFKDNSYLYLDDNFNRSIVDSTKIINGKFQFYGSVKEPSNFILRTQEYSEMTKIWIENSNITIEFKKGNSSNSIITGSQIHNRVNEFESENSSLILALSNRQSCKNSIADSIQSVLDNKYIEYIENNPEDIYSSYLLTCILKRIDKSQSSELYNKLNPDIRLSHFGKYIYKYIRYNKNLKTGYRTVNFGMRNPKDEVVYLKNYRGKYLLLSFWIAGSIHTTRLTNCQGCFQMNKTLVDFYDKYNSKGLEILSISLDRNKDDWIKGIKRDDLIWENVCDFEGFQGIVPITYSIDKIPSLILINSDGIIVETDIAKVEKTLDYIFNILLLDKEDDFLLN